MVKREFIEQTGVKLVVGKGGMGPLTEEGCQKFKALHVIFLIEFLLTIEWRNL